MKYTPYSLAAYIQHHMNRARFINASKGCTDPIILYLQFSEIAHLLGRERMTATLIVELRTELEAPDISVKQEGKTLVLTMSGSIQRTNFVSLTSLSEYK